MNKAISGQPSALDELNARFITKGSNSISTLEAMILFSRSTLSAKEQAAAELAELRAIQEFHPRAAKLANKQKPFIVIAIDEPYFREAYSLIRVHEKEKGTWTEEDESGYQFLCGVALGWSEEGKQP